LKIGDTEYKCENKNEDDFDFYITGDLSRYKPAILYIFYHIISTMKFYSLSY
jgi:hypothetical protein